MEPTYLGLIIAPLIAIIVSVIDLSVDKSRRLYRKVTLLCLLYFSFDAAAALILFGLLRAGADLLTGSPTTAAGVTAGLVAPLLMRTKIPRRFSNGGQPVNAVVMLRRLQIGVKGQIDDLCAAAETAWILDVVLPSIETLPLSEIKDWAIQSFNVSLKEPKDRRHRRRCIQKVEQAVLDAASSENECKHLIIQLLTDNCGRRQVLALVKRAQKKLAMSDGDYVQYHVTPSTIKNQSDPGFIESPVNNSKNNSSGSQSKSLGEDSISDEETKLDLLIS